MSSKKLRRKKIMEELTRKDIIESAIEIIKEAGEKQLTMDRVASGAGIAKGTVYLYYKNKQEMVDSVIDFIFMPLEKMWAEIIGKEGDPAWKLEECLRASLDLVENDRLIFESLRNVMFNYRDKYITDPDSWYWTAVKLFATVLDDGINIGRFRPMNSMKIAALFLDSIDGLLSMRILTDAAESIEEDVRDVMELYTKGLIK